MPAPRNDQALEWLAVLCRVLVGGTFLVAATLKLMVPVENFEAAVHAFELVPEFLERPIALALPWIELFAGAFCLFGLYTRWSAVVLAVMLIGFIGALVWVRLKGLNIEACGCFGQWDFVHTPTGLLIRDIVLLALTLPLLRRQRFRFSLEEYARARG
jgi:uncharacterized membrane protein YphA (DoxX/SURF4 family)